MRAFLILSFLCVPPVLAAPSKEVVVYTSVDDVFARPIAERFEREKGIKVKLVPDTEETKSTGLLNRLIAEKNRPQADVFWSGDPVRAAILKTKKLSTPFIPANSKDLPQLFSDPDGHWTGFSARARVILYNKNFFNEKDKPTSILDLIDSKYKGKGCLANPLFGTTSMHAAAIFEVLGESKAKNFFENLKKNEVKLFSSNGEVRRKVSADECVFGLTDTDDAFEAIKDKKPVGVVFPDEKGIGTLIVPNVTVLIFNAPHSQEGKAFIEYLLSPQTEETLAESDAAQMPVRSGVPTPSHVRPLEKIRPMKVNYVKLAARLEELSSGFLKTWVDSMSRR